MWAGPGASPGGSAPRGRGSDRLHPPDGGGVMTGATDRQLFRETLAQVAEQARAILPVSVNGRIESAMQLVLLGDVQPQDDGTVVVFSATDATRRYVLQGPTCTCTDFTQG